MIKKFLNQINIRNQCKRYGVPLWQCPQFLFLIMGFGIILTVLLTYFLGTDYIEDPSIVFFIVVFLTIFLITISYTITNSFERLAEVARMKSQFVSVASHHLRSPVTNLRWVIEFLMSGRAGNIRDGQKKYFEILEKNTKKMNILLRDLLIVSRFESGDFFSDKKETSLVEITQKALLDLKEEIDSFNAEINLNIEESLGKVFVDPLQIEIVIRNLLENAIFYGEKEQKTKVEVTIEKNSKKVYFKVKDDGIGISETDKKNIFKKFFRSQNATEYQTTGSGLGLYINKIIIENLGGKIGFKSKENEGSTFWFYLPIKK